MNLHENNTQIKRQWSINEYFTKLHYFFRIFNYLLSLVYIIILYIIGSHGIYLRDQATFLPDQYRLFHYTLDTEFQKKESSKSVT